jgi:hypothetical protein
MRFPEVLAMQQFPGMANLPGKLSMLRFAKK